MSFESDEIYEDLNPDEKIMMNVDASVSAPAEHSLSDSGHQFHRLMLENQRLRAERNKDQIDAGTTIARLRSERDKAESDNGRLREQRDWAISNSAELENKIRDLDREFWSQRLVQSEVYVANLRKRLVALGTPLGKPLGAT